MRNQVQINDYKRRIKKMKVAGIRRAIFNINAMIEGHGITTHLRDHYKQSIELLQGELKRRGVKPQKNLSDMLKVKKSSKLISSVKTA